MGKMPNLGEIYEYLDELRSSGITNMFGAAPYIAEEFQIDDHAARRALTGWMKTYDPAIPAIDRVVLLEVSQ